MGMGARETLGVCDVCVCVLYHYHVYRVGKRAQGYVGKCALGALSCVL